MKAVALVPARSGSLRVPHKNIRRLEGHPLMAYTIRAAVESGCFDAVVVSTDDERYADCARHYGAEVPFLRPAELATATSPDIEWVSHALETLRRQGRSFDLFSILRPTSPFRGPDTIRRAFDEFRSRPGIHSMRAVQPCSEHPGKMWRVMGGLLVPILPVQEGPVPFHSRQTQTLPEVWVQNASLELARVDCVREMGSISGELIAPFFTRGHEGLDVNTEYDWHRAEWLLARGEARLPEVSVEPWDGGAGSADG
ncbi:MAG: CMP-N,N'-diacetyllegionaminic acid synthase [Acidimicrobiales bacterium]|nr:MAG: CMP-N,N'-diacetyllegionaminic acid synthase [Acidimicrobiales bacterium]